MNLGAELLKDVHKMRSKIVSKFSNFDDAIAFGEVFRINLYNAIKNLKVEGKVVKDDAASGLDMKNLSFIIEDQKSSAVSILSIIFAFWFIL